MDILKLANKAKNLIEKNKPELLIALGITGYFTATCLAVKSTPKALQNIEKEKEKKKDLTKKDIIKVSWKCYIPSVITFGVSTACIIGANSVNSSRNAALAAAYSLSEKALSDYKEAAVDVIGEKKEKDIQDKVSEKKIENDPVCNKEVIITGKGEQLCYDCMSGRYFKSDIDKIRKAENEINKRLRSEMYVSLNDFYYELGLRPVQLGDEMGWNIDYELELSFSSQLADDGTPCLVINYLITPRYDYTKLM